MSTDAESSGQSKTSTPLRCQKCHAEMVWPVVCEQCRALYPPTEQVDYFELLGLPRRYEIDPAKLHREFLALNRRVHPDYFSSDDEDAQTASLRITAQINNAYETLRDPVQRAEYILQSCGGKAAGEDKSVPPNLLGTIMMLRDEIEEAREASDAAALEDLAAQIRSRKDELLRVIGQLAGKLCEQPTDEDRAELRKQLNAYQYWTGLERELAGS